MVGNNADYTITNVTTGVVVQTGSLDNPDDGGVDADNFAGNESGNDYFCLCDAGCYEITVSGGDWPGEVGWALNTADGLVNLLSGDAPNGVGTFQFSIGGAICGCTDPSACNFDIGASVDDGSCEFDSCAVVLILLHVTTMLKLPSMTEHSAASILASEL